MAFEQRDMSGSIFRNERKEKETHPNLTGSAMVGGVEYWVSAWTKRRDNGEQWISLSFKPKDQPASGASYRAGREDYSRPGKPADLDDDIPF